MGRTSLRRAAPVRAGPHQSGQNKSTPGAGKYCDVYLNPVFARSPKKFFMYLGILIGIRDTGILLIEKIFDRRIYGIILFMYLRRRSGDNRKRIPDRKTLIGLFFPCTLGGGVIGGLAEGAQMDPQNARIPYKTLQKP